MTLHRIVAALGGDLYQGGRRANVPAPGHSRRDRSISLLLVGDRVVIHGFGGTDWRAARDALRRRGLIDANGRLGAQGDPAPAWSRPDDRVRQETALRLWEQSGPVGTASAAALHLRRRAILADEPVGALRCHPRAPLRVYGEGGRGSPALVARIDDPSGGLTAVELTYLDPAGRAVPGLVVGRKTVGCVPPGSAVRLAQARDALLVGEGVLTTLSAMDRFGLPGWALLGVSNLVGWSPPPGVERVMIAADRGTAGERAAARLRDRLLAIGRRVEVRGPPEPHGDWNAFAMAGMKEREGR
jgi:hypothetical protein